MLVVTIIVGLLLGTDLPLRHGLSCCLQVKQAPSTHHSGLGNLFNNGAMTTSYVAMQAVNIQDVGAITEIAEVPDPATYRYRERHGR